jgi:hypothetical protein
MLVGEYAAYVSSLSFIDYRDLKKALWVYFGEQINDLRLDFLKDIPFKLEVESSQHALDQLTALTAHQIDLDSLRQFAETQIDNSTDSECARSLKDRMIDALNDDTFRIFAAEIENLTELSTVSALISVTHEMQQQVDQTLAATNSDTFYAYYRWAAAYQNTKPLLRLVVDLFDQQQLDTKLWSGLFAAMYYECLFKKSLLLSPTKQLNLPASH